MGYVVYVKDKGTKGRFDQWTRKKHSNKSSAQKELAEARMAYKKPKHKKYFGKPTFQIRKVQSKQKGIFGGKGFRF